MRKQTVLLILFFGGLWGAAEASLGGALYSIGAPRASVWLTISALLILSVARVYCPTPGSSTLIASCAMLLKFANSPFFGCHLLGVFMLGAAFDLALLASRHNLLTAHRRVIKNAALGAATAYLSFAMFALLITYVFRYPHWPAEGLPRVLDHIFLSGSLAAVGGAVAVPLGARLGEILKTARFAPFELASRVTTGGMSLLTMLLWIAAACVSF
jgi:hypothetical protein